MIYKYTRISKKSNENYVHMKNIYFYLGLYKYIVGVMNLSYFYN